MAADARLTAAATARNRAPILEVLAGLLAPGDRVLEVASGTGEHAVHFATGLSGIVWQPSDCAPELLASIAAHAEAAQAAGLLTPIHLDVMRPADWPAGPFDAVFTANLTHIAPWPVTLALLDGAARVLRPGGLLLLYGPFLRRGVATAPSNLAFDEALRSRDPAWGLRELDGIAGHAGAVGLGYRETREMPANNVIAVFEHGWPAR